MRNGYLTMRRSWRDKPRFMILWTIGSIEAEEGWSAPLRSDQTRSVASISGPVGERGFV